MRALIVLLIAVPSLLLLAACGDDDEEEEGATTVEVTLQEWSVGPDTDSAPAGEITFQATNDGPEHEHELVIIKTDLDPGDLPTKDDGSADEEGEGIEVIDEIEEFDVGGTESLTATLEAGSYALICNVVEEQVHYANGMFTAFTVE